MIGILFVYCVVRKDSLSTINLYRAVSGKSNTKHSNCNCANCEYIFIYGNAVVMLLNNCGMLISFACMLLSF